MKTDDLESKILLFNPELMKAANDRGKEGPQKFLTKAVQNG